MYIIYARISSRIHLNKLNKREIFYESYLLYYCLTKIFHIIQKLAVNKNLCWHVATEKNQPLQFTYELVFIPRRAFSS